jgi:hypothetical protein
MAFKNLSEKNVMDFSRYNFEGWEIWTIHPCNYLDLMLIFIGWPVLNKARYVFF